MFSRFVNSARSLINPLPHTPKKQPLKTQVHTPTKTMVTTRNQRERNSAEGIDSTEEESNVYVPISSAKRKSQKISLDDEVTSSPSAKKRKILPVRAKEEDVVVAKSRLVVEIPVRNITPPLEGQGKADVSIERIDSMKKHKKFGSEEPELEPHIFSTAPEQPEIIDSEVDEEETDNDAPEEVDAQDAARVAKVQAQSAADAIKRLVYSI